MPQQVQYEHLRRDSGTGQYYGYTSQGGWTPISPKDAAAAIAAHANNVVRPNQTSDQRIVAPTPGTKIPAGSIIDARTGIIFTPEYAKEGEQQGEKIASTFPYVAGMAATMPIGGEGVWPVLGRIMASSLAGGTAKAVMGGKPREIGSTALTLGELQIGGEILGKLVGFALKAPSLFRGSLQKSLGVGPKFIAKKEAEAAEEYASGVAKQEEAYKSKVASEDEKYNAKVAQQQTKRAEQIQGVGKKYLNDKAEVEATQKASSRSEQLRAYLKDKHNSLITSLQKNIQATHDAVRSALDQRWGALRSKVGEVPIDIAPIQDAIKNAQQNILRGSPESITIFNNILREGEPGIEQASIFQGAGQLGRGEAGVPLGKAGISRNASSLALNPEIRAFFEAEAKGSGGEVSFNNARGYYTELGDKMFGGRELPGDVYRALRSVRESIDDQLTRAADRVGVGKSYASLKSDWHQYEEDFRSMKSMAVGGSPIARILKAVDPGYVENPALGKTSQRLMATMAKYKNFGANPDLLADLRRTDSALSKIPKAKQVGIPSRPEIPPKPAPIERPHVPRPEIPERVPINAKVEQLKQLDKKIEQLQHLSPYELISTAWGLGEMLRGGLPYGFVYPVVKHLMARALETPEIQEWLLREVADRASMGRAARATRMIPTVGTAASGSQR